MGLGQQVGERGLVGHRLHWHGRRARSIQPGPARAAIQPARRNRPTWTALGSPGPFQTARRRCKVSGIRQSRTWRTCAATGLGAVTVTPVPTTHGATAAAASRRSSPSGRPGCQRQRSQNSQAFQVEWTGVRALSESRCSSSHGRRRCQSQARGRSQAFPWAGARSQSAAATSPSYCQRQCAAAGCGVQPGPQALRHAAAGESAGRCWRLRAGSCQCGSLALVGLEGAWGGAGSHDDAGEGAQMEPPRLGIGLGHKRWTPSWTRQLTRNLTRTRQA